MAKRLPIAIAACLILTSAAMASAAPLRTRRGTAVQRARASWRQKAAQEAAMKALRELSAATQGRLSFGDYQDRLIDARTVVNKEIRAVPAGPAKARILDVLQTYLDASIVWDNILQWQYRSAVKESDAFRIIRKYRLPWNDAARTARVDNAETRLWVATLWIVAADKLNKEGSTTPPRAIASSLWSGGS